MANKFLTRDEVSYHTLDSLDNMLVLGNIANREYDSRFAVEGAKIGDKFTQRKPMRYVVQSGEDIGEIQGLEDDSVVIEIEHQDHIPIQFGQRERALSMDDYRRRYIDPMTIALTNKVDKRGYNLYKGVYNNSGTAGTVPADTAVYLDAGVRLANSGCPMDAELGMIVSPRMMASQIKAEQALFHASDEIRSQYLRGQMGQAHGFTWYRSQNPVAHTTGAWLGAGRVNGANQTGSELVTDNWTGSISKLLRWGDNFSITGLNSVNVQTFEDTGELAQFVVTKDVDSVAGAATVPFFPPIVLSGPKQTVVSAPAHQAPLILHPASKSSVQGLALHRDALALTIVDLPQPVEGSGKLAKRIQSKKYRFAFQMVSDFDIKTYKNIQRLDLLYAWTLMREELISRIYGS